MMRFATLLVVLLTIVGVISDGKPSSDAETRPQVASKDSQQSSIAEKMAMVKGHLDEAVALLKKVNQQQPVFGPPLVRATTTIETLNTAIQKLAEVYANGTNPTGGYKAAGPRYGGAKKVQYKPPGY